jgi:hypothetical protein
MKKRILSISIIACATLVALLAVACPTPTTDNSSGGGSGPHVAVSDVTLDKATATITIYINAAEKLVAAVVPVNASNPVVTWTSSNDGIATVGADGTVTAIKYGDVTITATAVENPDKKASCAVTVKDICASGYDEMEASYLYDKYFISLNCESSLVPEIRTAVQLSAASVLKGWVISSGMAHFTNSANVAVALALDFGKVDSSFGKVMGRFGEVDFTVKAREAFDNMTDETVISKIKKMLLALKYLPNEKPGVADADSISKVQALIGLYQVVTHP